jgi:hypothetical protein
MATPSRERPDGVEELLCAGCMDWFVPQDGKIDVIRTAPEDSGSVICTRCRDALASRGIAHLDLGELKCTCQSMDPNRTFCGLHLKPNELNVH